MTPRRGHWEPFLAGVGVGIILGSLGSLAWPARRPAPAPDAPVTDPEEAPDA